MRSPRRVGIIVVVAIVGATALASRLFGAKENGETRFRTESVSRGALIASVTATGTVNPLKTVQVGTYVSGPVQAIDVDFNSPVRSGQRMFSYVAPSLHPVTMPFVESKRGSPSRRINTAGGCPAVLKLSSAASRSSTPYQIVRNLP